MNQLSKNKPQHIQKLRDAAKDCPVCMLCGKHNDGTIVGAHYSGWRQHEFGKGMSGKCSDSYIAYLCMDCHGAFDQYHDDNRIERSERFMLAILRSHDWLLKEGILK